MVRLGVATAALGAVVFALPHPSALGAEPPKAQPAPSAAQQRAVEHFQKARALYGEGKYSEAVSELEFARSLDPTAKDLVMNLGIVHEKLGSYEAALENLRIYVEMESVTAQERAKAETMMKRIEGAIAAEAENAKRRTATSRRPAGSTTEPPQAPLPPRKRGRIDALTVTAGAVAVAGIGLGTGLGLYALSSRPSDTFVTGRDGSFSALSEKADAAHRTALFADVSFAVGAVAAVSCVLLYAGRYEPTPQNVQTAHVRIMPSASPTGAGVSFGGDF